MSNDQSPTGWPFHVVFILLMICSLIFFSSDDLLLYTGVTVCVRQDLNLQPRCELPKVELQHLSKSTVNRTNLSIRGFLSYLDRTGC